MRAMNALMLPRLLVCTGSFLSATPLLLDRPCFVQSIFDNSLCLSCTAESLHCFFDSFAVGVAFGHFQVFFKLSSLWALLVSRLRSLRSFCVHTQLL